MGNEVSIVAPEIRRAAGNVDEAAGIVAKVALAGPLDHVITMCQEIGSAGPLKSAATRLQTEWRDDKSTWAQYARQHANGMRTAADQLTEVDALSAAEARRIGVDLTKPYVDADPTTKGVQQPTTKGVEDA